MEFYPPSNPEKRVLEQGRAAVNEDGSLYLQHAKINTPNK